MLTQQEYQDVVYNASRANGVLISDLRNKEALGMYPNWNTALCQELKILSGQWSISVQDYTSTASVDIYNQLMDIASLWTGGIIPDPNAQLPTQTIVTIPVLIGQNTGTILFSTTSGSPALTLNYANYKQLYGNNPDLAIYTTVSGEQEDVSTAPIIVRVNPSDVNSDIVSITWPYPVATTGYILISGEVPAGSGTPSGGSGGAIALNYTEANLLQDGNGSWYLPLMLPSGKVVVYAASNSVSFGFTYDPTFTPARLYGFANGGSQSILVKVI